MRTLGLTLLACLAWNHHAQALVVDLSHSTDGDMSIFQHRTAGFGPAANSYGVSGKLVRTDPVNACSATVESEPSLNGSIALIVRGDCTFAEKVLRAQKAGAYGVIVGNDKTHVEQEGDHLATMSLSNQFDSKAYDYTIPSVFVTYETFAKISAMLDAGEVNAVLDSRGEYTSPTKNNAKDITNYIRLLLFMAAAFPSLWMFWLMCLIGSRSFQSCFDRCKRRSRLEEIPTVKYSPEYSHDKSDPEYIHNTSCVICLDEFMEGQTLKRLPCSHAFCSGCIQSWLADRSDQCPICKQSILNTPQGVNNNRGCWQTCCRSSRRRRNYQRVNSETAMPSASPAGRSVDMQDVDSNRRDE